MFQECIGNVQHFGKKHTNPSVPFAYVPDPGRPDLVIGTMHLQLVSVK